MNRMLSLMFFIAAIAAWCQPSFAQQTIAGGGTVPINATGIAQGVAITGNTTLTVGVPGGPETDIFTNNSATPRNGALAVSTAASSQGNIVFNSASTVFGNIGVTQPGGPFLLNISGGNTGTAVNFLGQAFATTLNVTGTGTVNFNSGSTNIMATNFAADGTIRLAPNTTLIGALTTTAGANTGTLVLGGGSILNGAVGGAVGLKAINVAGGSNLAGVSANITGAVDAFSFNLGTNTLTVGGALTIANQGTAGVINTTLASPTVFGKIRPVGATNLGPTLGINVTVPATAFIPVGTQFNIVQTQTGTSQSGTGGSVLVVTVQNPTNPLYTFSPVPLAGTVAGLVEIQVTGVPLQVAPNPIVPVLLATPLTPDVAAVLAAVDALSDPAAVANAVTQLGPSTPDLAAPLVTFQGTRQFQNLWMSRLDTTLCNQFSQPAEENLSCQGNDRRDGWWLKGFGYFGSQDARQGIAGYDSRIGGGMLAYDAPLGPNTRAGLGIGYARSIIDGRTFSTSTDSNSYQATAYLGHEVGPWFAYGDVSFGWNEYSGTRNISFPGISRTAGADYSGQDYTAYGNTGYNFSAQEFTLTPFASLQYTHVNLDGYSETGAGDINLKVSSQSYDFLESGLGVKAARDVRYRDKVYVPEIHLKWLHELNNPTLQQNAAFTVAGAPSFTTAGLKTSDDTYNVGAGLSLLSCACSARTWSLEAAYDYNWRTDGYHAHQAMMRLSSRF